MTIKQSREALKHLLFYNNKAATFRSPALKAAMENVLYTSNDILAVLPTGIGKSLLFLLYTCVHQSLTAVVVVPTMSLAEDIMHQAASHGLSSANNVSNFHNERLIVTPEATVMQCLKDLLMQIYVQKKVGCHLCG